MRYGSGSPGVDTTYDGGGVHTNMSREGLDIGMPGDFAADWAKFKPAQQQARDLRNSNASPQVRGPVTQPRRMPVNDMGGQTIYGKYTTVNGQTFLQEVAEGTAGANPISTLPAGHSRPVAQIHFETLGGGGRGGGGGGGGGAEGGGYSSADQSDAMRGVNPNSGYSYLPAGEQARYQQSLAASNADIAARNAPTS